MPVVTNTVKKPDGTISNGGTVIISLVGTNGRHIQGFVDDGTDYRIAGAITLTISSVGVWSTNLISTDLIAPTGARWKIDEKPEGANTNPYYIEVPNGAGPYEAREREVDAPGAVASSALSAYVIATDARLDALEAAIDGGTP